MSGNIDNRLELSALFFMRVSINVDMLIELLCLAIVNRADLFKELCSFGRICDCMEVSKKVLLVVLLEFGFKFRMVLHRQRI